MMSEYRHVSATSLFLFFILVASPKLGISVRRSVACGLAGTLPVQLFSNARKELLALSY